MLHPRRKFLQGLSAGMVGLAGLFLPHKVLAWPWRRRRCYPFVRTGLQRPKPTAAPAISIAYPTPAASVPGSGGFCAWGTTNASVQPNSAKATWSGGSSTGTSVTAPAPNTWAFSVPNCKTNIGVTLTVSDSQGNVNQVTFTCV